MLFVLLKLDIKRIIKSSFYLNKNHNRAGIVSVQYNHSYSSVNQPDYLECSTILRRVGQKISGVV